QAFERRRQGPTSLFVSREATVDEMLRELERRARAPLGEPVHPVRNLFDARRIAEDRRKQRSRIGGTERCEREGAAGLTHALRVVRFGALYGRQDEEERLVRRRVGEDRQHRGGRSVALV